ncbi:hypothetical protein ILUMI_12345, partial [Ignelater luminosus]
MQENHDSELAGHSGLSRTYKQIRETYINKTNFKPTKAPMETTSTSSTPFERLAIDIVGPFPQTINNNSFILTMQDALKKFSYAILIENCESQTIAIELSKFIRMFGIPKSNLSAQGTDKINQES